MASIIERISEAEENALTIKREAVAAAKTRIADAELDAKQELSAAAKQAARMKTASAQEAENSSEAMGREILSTNNKNSDAICERARANMDSAVAYIVERVLEV